MKKGPRFTQFCSGSGFAIVNVDIVIHSSADDSCFDDRQFKFKPAAADIASNKFFMSPRAERIAADAAEMDVLYGIIAGVVIAILRAIGVVGALVGDGPTLNLLLVENVVVLALVVLFTYGVYRQRSSAAIALAVLFAIAYLYSWYLLQKLIPPLGLIGLLIWYGLYRGIRGTRFLARRSRSGPPVTSPVDEKVFSR